MNREEWLEHSLNELREQQLERNLRVFPAPGGRLLLDGRPVLNFASNDYLDLAGHPRVRQRALEALAETGASASASRLMGGNLPIHVRLEETLASWTGYPATLVYGSGYLASIGLFPALAGAEDHFFADRLVHACIVDGMLLSKARIHRFRHNDPAHLQACMDKVRPGGRRFIVTESVFSMDGDRAPLADYARIAEERGAELIVDEAHAIGVAGPGGSGLVRELGLSARIPVTLFTLGKALGSYGGVAACSLRMKQWLLNKSRSFIFSTALPPAIPGAALGALEVIRDHPGLGDELLRRAALFRAALARQGIATGNSSTQIVPVILGDNARALTVAEKLRKQAIHVQAIRPPTVPAGTARLRFSITLAHTDDDLQGVAAKVKAAMDEAG